MLSLGNMYSFGEGVPQNDVQAHVWFNLTASRETGFLRDLDVSNLSNQFPLLYLVALGCDELGWLGFSFVFSF